MTRVRAAAIVAISAALGCRGEGARRNDAGGPHAGADATVAALRARPQSPLGASIASGFDAVSNGFSPRFAAAAGRVSARTVLPARASGGIHLEDAASGASADVSLDGARDVDAQASGGYLVYPGAHVSGATLLHRPIPTGAEDFISFDARPAASEISYRLKLGERVAGLRLVEGILELLDAGGAPRLRVDPPYIVGADGARADAVLAVAGCAVDRNPAAPWGRPVAAPGAKTCTVRVSWRGAGIAYPAVLDPRWTTTGNMVTARTDHTAIALSTGKVLVACGRASTTSTTGLATAELFDPMSGTWAATGNLTGTTPGRWSHSATQLNTGSNATTSGKVLLAGGINGAVSVNTAQLYTVSGTGAGTWATAGNLNVARHLHTATLLPNGNVLVAGGVTSTTVGAMTTTTVLNSAAIYNPSNNAGTWTAVGPPMSTARRFHSATLLPASSNMVFSNKVLIAGGNSGGTTSVASAQLFNPSTSTWSTTTALPAAREGHTATMLANGNVLITGGRTGTGAPLASALVFTIPTSGTASWASAGSMTVARVAHTATLLPAGVVANGQVLVAGGSTDGTNPITGADIWNGTTTWTATSSVLSTAVQAHTATSLVGGAVLVAGGNSGTSAVNAAQIFDPFFCAANSECASGFCVSGVCCNTACTNECSACNLSGSVGTCSPKANGTACTDEGNPCTTDTCNGSGTCQHAAGNMGAPCRNPAGECDVGATCTGTSTTCPANPFKMNGTACRDDGNVCTTDLCSGSSATCVHAAGNPGTPCRNAVGDCDVAATCTGSSTTCPANPFKPSTIVCRAAASGGCDVAENCTGSSATCPADLFAPPSTVCRPSAGQCDVAETCTGTSASCPADALASNGTACNDANFCTLGDTCQGGACVGGSTNPACHLPPALTPAQIADAKAAGLLPGAYVAPTIFPPLGDAPYNTVSIALAVNNAGAVAGYTHGAWAQYPIGDNAFPLVADANGERRLPTPWQGPSATTYAVDINESGFIAGEGGPLTYNAGFDFLHPIVYPPGGATYQLPWVSTIPGMQVFAMNNVIGTAGLPELVGGAVAFAGSGPSAGTLDVWHFDNDGADALGPSGFSPPGGVAWVAGHTSAPGHTIVSGDAAISLDGNECLSTSSMVSLGDNTIAGGINSAAGLTALAWVKPDAATCPGTRAIASRGSEFSIWLDCKPDGSAATLRAFSHTTTGDHWTTGVGTVPFSQWSHVAVTWDKARARSFVNGALVGDEAFGGLVPPTSSWVSVGCWPPSPANNFKGAIDEVSMFQNGVGADEIALHARDVTNYNRSAAWGRIQDGFFNIIEAPPGPLFTGTGLAFRVNDAGVAVGYQNLTSGLTAAFMFDPANGWKNLNDLLGPDTGWDLQEAIGIDQGSRFVVGDGLYYGRSLPFRLDLLTGELTDLGLPAGFPGDPALIGVAFAHARAINSSGHVVGDVGAINSSNDHAFIYAEATGVVDLNDFIDPASGWTIGEAFDINDNDEVVGWARHANADGSTTFSAFKMKVPLLPSIGTVSCIGQPDGTACDDLDACTTGEACHGGICGRGTAVVCPGGDQCHDACDPTAGCHAPVVMPNGTACNDGNACTRADSCQAGTCTGANPVVCTAQDQCHLAGACNPADGTCSQPRAADGIACSDGNRCTAGDTCRAGTCLPGATNACAGQGQTSYTSVIDLGSAQGLSYAVSINNNGVVVGTDVPVAAGVYQTGYVGSRAFRWSPSEGMVYLPGSPTLSYADAINDAGVISMSTGTTQGVMFPCRYDPAVDTQPACQSSQGFSTGINAAGTVTGWIAQPTALRAFRLGTAPIEVLPSVPNSADTLDDRGVWIDADGTVVGTQVGYGGVRYSTARGTEVLADLLPPGSDWNLASPAFIRSGEIIGWGVHGGERRAFRIKTTPNGDVGSVAALPMPSTFASDAPNLMAADSSNAAGEIVGTIWDPGATFPQDAFVYTDANGTVDLNSLIDPQSGWTLIAAWSINDHHEVVGIGNHDGAYHAYKLTLPDLSACPSDSCHVAARDPLTGACSSTVKPDGSACDDGNACTQNDVCTAGSCQGATAFACVAPNTCQDTGTCNPTAPSAGPPSPQDLIGWWKLDGDGRDATIGKHDLTVEGNVTPVPGRVGLAMAFDGTSCMTTPIWPEARMQGASGVTMMAWVNPSAQIVCPGGQTPAAVMGRSFDYSLGSWCYPTPGIAATGTVRTAGAQTWGYPGGLGLLPPNQWTHVAVTWDHNRITIYINGNANGLSAISYPDPGAFGDVDSTFAIGCLISYYFTLDQRIWNFKGAIDEAMLYRRVLSPSEILAYYTAADPCTHPVHADGSACTDFNLCTQTDTCQAGACVGTNPVVCTADQCHDAGTCVSYLGTCTGATPKADGTTCNDGNACTRTDVCQAGACVGANPTVCLAQDSCHTATCDQSTGQCTSATNGGTCDLGAFDYDKAGRLIRDRGAELHYDAYDQLREVLPTASPPPFTNLPVDNLWTPNGVDETQALANHSNSKGHVPVAVSLAAGGFRTLLFEGNGTPVDLTAAAGMGTSVYGNSINDADTVGGNWMPTPGGGSHAFRYDQTGFHDLGNAGDSTFVFDINNQNQLAGYFLTGSNANGVRYSDATGFQPIGTLGGAQSWGWRVDDLGIVSASAQTADSPSVGFARFGHAALFHDLVGLQDLNAFVDPMSGTTLAIANEKQGDYVVGIATTTGIPQRAFRLRLSTGALDDIGWAGSSYAYSVNSAGDAVGWGYTDAAETVQAAWILSERTGFAKLNDLIDPASGWDLRTASSVDESGDVVGWGYHNGRVSAYRLRIPAHSSGTGGPTVAEVHTYGYDGLRTSTTTAPGTTNAHTQVWFTQDYTEHDGKREHYIRIGNRIVAKVTLQPPMAGSGGGSTGVLIDPRHPPVDLGDLVARILLALLIAAGLATTAAALVGKKRRPAWVAITAGPVVLFFLGSCDKLNTSRRSAETVWQRIKIVYFHHGIGAGPALTTNDDGTLNEERRYEPFGQPVDANVSGTLGPVDLRREQQNSLGKLTNPNTGWSYHGARWMQPQTARWTAPDSAIKGPDEKSIIEPWRLNPYVYVQASPTLFWDPDGAELHVILVNVAGPQTLNANDMEAITDQVLQGAQLLDPNPTVTVVDPSNLSFPLSPTEHLVFLAKDASGARAAAQRFSPQNGYPGAIFNHMLGVPYDGNGSHAMGVTRAVTQQSYVSVAGVRDAGEQRGDSRDLMNLAIGNTSLHEVTHQILRQAMKGLLDSLGITVGGHVPKAPNTDPSTIFQSGYNNSPIVDFGPVLPFVQSEVAAVSPIPPDPEPPTEAPPDPAVFP